MNLLALLAALVAQSTWPLRDPHPVGAFYGRLCVSAAKRLDAGDRNSGILGWFVLQAVVLVPLALVLVGAHAILPALAWLLDVAVAYATLRFLGTTRHLSTIESLLREGNADAASQKLSQWLGEPANTADPGEVATLAAEQALREAHQGTFAPLFWYLLLPGPLGLVLYPLALRAMRTWESGIEPGERDFGWFAARAFAAIDWIPQRVTAFAFAVVGDFEDAFFCWRSQAAQWIRAEEGIVLASGAGALRVRLGDAISRSGAAFDRPGLGTGEPAREDALASLGGLLWRCLVLWFVVFLLAAALHIA